MNFLNKTIPPSLESLFCLPPDHHQHNTRGVRQKKIYKKKVQTTNYGLQSIEYKAATNWNEIQTKIDFNFQENFLSVKFTKAFKNLLFT